MWLKINWTLKNENKISPSNHFGLNLAGYYLIFVFLVGFLSNFILILVFLRYNLIKFSLNRLIFVMTVFNLIGTVQFPFVIVSNFEHK